jgi:hypothetical protein
MEDPSVAESTDGSDSPLTSFPQALHSPSENFARTDQRRECLGI